MNSTRLRYWMASTFWPGVIPSDSRICRGITTWNFGDTVTADVIPPYDDASNYHGVVVRFIGH